MQKKKNVSNKKSSSFFLPNILFLGNHPMLPLCILWINKRDLIVGWCCTRPRTWTVRAGKPLSCIICL